MMDIAVVDMGMLWRGREEGEEEGKEKVEAEEEVAVKEEGEEKDQYACISMMMRG